MRDFEDDSDFMASDSGDDDLEMLINAPRKNNENYLDETVPNYDKNQFVEHFCISREIANTIAVRYEESEQYKRGFFGQYGELLALSQVLVFLWYIGHQTSSFCDVAERFDISLSSLCRIIRRVVIFISNLSPQFITWPAENEKITIESHFRGNGFPRVIGAIDGCHVRIDKPENDPDLYMNRKSFYSIQMQFVCNHRRRIRDIFVGYPGSVNDSRVFRNSPLSTNLEEKCGRYFLLGDSGYPLKKNLLTPFKDRGQLTRRQMNYNVKLSQNRHVIEHCFGILKQKFRQLYHIKLRNIKYIVHLIRAAYVLHNISINDKCILNEPIHVVPGIILPQDDMEFMEEEDRAARRVRDDIVNGLRM